MDVQAAAQAYSRLLSNRDLRQNMGRAGRRRAERQFAWQHVIRAYETLWDRQEMERIQFVHNAKVFRKTPLGPAAYPALERSFAGYPTSWLDLQQRVAAVPTALARLEELLATALVNYEPDGRCGDAEQLRSALTMASAACTLADLEALFRQSGLSSQHARHPGVDAQIRLAAASLLSPDLRGFRTQTFLRYCDRQIR